MTNELLTFKSFYTEEEARSLIDFLSENGLEAVLAKNRPIMDKVYIGEDYDRPYHVRIRSTEFNRANEVIDKMVAGQLSQIGPDYYLHGFSNEELLEIVEKRDEWNNQDFVIAKKILADRGVMIREADLGEKKKKRITELARPSKGSRSMFLVGYMLAIFFPPGGIIFGSLILNAKTTLPDGTRLNAYDRDTRAQGKTILIIGAILTTLVLIRTVMRV